MEEQRIKNLEEELKVLKNQIRAVLLDIKEQLATGTGGNGQSATPPWAGAGQASTPPWASAPAPAAGSPHLEGGTNISLDVGQLGTAGRESVAGRDAPAGAAVYPERAAAESAQSAPGFLEKEKFASSSGKESVASVAAAAGEASSEGRVDLLTISVLAQWLSRAAETVSKEQIAKLIEIYDITGNLPPRLKQAILLLADLYGDGNKGVEDDEDLPAAVSLQLLIELDSLLRYRTGALESVVLSMLLDRGQGSRRVG